jgi:plasmid stabilization system protein ParE
MRLVLHPKVWSDVDAIMGYYEKVASPKLADEFYAELRRFIDAAAAHPHSFTIREHDLRRVNLKRFPYHFLFRITDDAVRILVVRHHHRDPSFGRRRR